MSKLKVGFIGTGKVPERASAMGYAMAYRHGDAYARLADDCDMVACADIVEANGRAFADKYGFDKVYLDYHEMLAEEDLDIVSICTWPKLHCEMVVDCCVAGVPAVHSEKPMALTYGDSRKMLQVATQYGTTLTFNHQRRFGKPFRNAHKLVQDGEIGALVRMEANVGDLYDGGTHWVDLLNYMNDETPAAWVIGQIDCREERLAFGAPIEWQGICQVKYRNGVYGLFVTGVEVGQDMGCSIRLIGKGGVAEIAYQPKPGPMLRYWKRGVSDWIAVDCEGETLHGPGYIERAIAQVVECAKSGGESELCARHAMSATEIIFACYESSRRRARIDLPLDIDDSPIQAMIESGDVPFRPAGT